MSPLIRMAAATVLAMGAPGALAVLPQAAAAPMQPRYSALPAESGSSAGLAKFGACLYGKKTADVVLLLDESGSLQGSDPDGARVTAAKYLVKQWSALSLETGVKIAIQTMGFSGGVQDASGRWLDAGRDLPQLKNDLDGFRTRDTGQQTDYWMALDGARKALTQRAAKGGSSCQAVLWFSDGKLDAFATYPNADGKNIVKPYLDKKTDDATANAAAAKDLCRKGGLADQVRSLSLQLSPAAAARPRREQLWSGLRQGHRRLSPGHGHRPTDPGVRRPPGARQCDRRTVAQGVPGTDMPDASAQVRPG